MPDRRPPLGGLDLSRRFFTAWGLPFLRTWAPDLLDRLVAGKVGGSDTRLADDRISQDHDWGPVFELWMPDDLHARDGERLRKALNDAAPSAWEGVERPANATPVEVHPLRGFVEQLAGRCDPPADGAVWMPSQADEAGLSDLVDGAVYHDPAGAFRALQAAWAAFGRDDCFRLRRLRVACFDAWHFGEYNLPRLLHRDDPGAEAMARGRFIEAVLGMVLAMHGRFRPYWKWMRHAVAALPDADGLMAGLVAFSAAGGPEERIAQAAGICRVLRGRLIQAGLAEDVASTSLFWCFLALQRRLAERRTRYEVWYTEPHDRLYDRLAGL